MTQLRPTGKLVVACTAASFNGGCVLNIPLPDHMPQSMAEYEVAEVSEQVALLVFFGPPGPIKAFHADGTISVFRDFGLSDDLDYLVGEGIHYSLDLDSSAAVGRVPLDSVVGVFPLFWPDP